MIAGDVLIRYIADTLERHTDQTAKGTWRRPAGQITCGCGNSYSSNDPDTATRMHLEHQAKMIQRDVLGTYTGTDDDG